MARVAAAAAKVISRAPTEAAVHHDRVVDHDAHHQGEPEHGVGVEGEAEHVHDDERAQDRGGDGEEDVERRGPRAQEDPAHEAGQQRGEDEGEEDLVDRVLDEDGGVEVDGDGEALGDLPLDLDEPRPHVAPDLHRVRPAELGDPEPDGRLAVGPGEATPVLEAVLDHRDVPQAHRGAAPVGDDEVSEALDVDRLPFRADVHLARVALDPARGHLEVLALDRAVHVRHGQALRLQPDRVVPHPHVAVAEALELDLAHPGDRLELGADHVADVVGHEGRRAAADDGDPHDRLVLGVRLGDDRRVDAHGQATLQLGELALHVLEGHVDVALELELDGDVAAALARGGRDLLDPFDGGHRILHQVDDVRLHDLGRRALPGDGDVHDREVHVGVLADPQPLENGPEPGEAEDPEPDEGEHQDPGEDVVPDRDVGECHPGRDLLGVLLRL